MLHNRRLQTLKKIFSFIFVSASWAKKEEKSRCLVS